MRMTDGNTDTVKSIRLSDGNRRRFTSDGELHTATKQSRFNY